MIYMYIYIYDRNARLALDRIAMLQLRLLAHFEIRNVR
jgi:hypothetical protein